MNLNSVKICLDLINFSQMLNLISSLNVGTFLNFRCECEAILFNLKFFAGILSILFYCVRHLEITINKSFTLSSEQNMVFIFSVAYYELCIAS